MNSNWDAGILNMAPCLHWTLVLKTKERTSGNSISSGFFKTLNKMQGSATTT